MKNELFSKKRPQISQIFFNHEGTKGTNFLDADLRRFTQIFSQLWRLWPSFSTKQTSVKRSASAAGSFFNDPFGRGIIYYGLDSYLVEGNLAFLPKAAIRIG
jgi:hypothetical protein